MIQHVTTMNYINLYCVIGNKLHVTSLFWAEWQIWKQMKMRVLLLAKEKDRWEDGQISTKLRYKTIFLVVILGVSWTNTMILKAIFIQTQNKTFFFTWISIILTINSKSNFTEKKNSIWKCRSIFLFILHNTIQCTLKIWQICREQLL